MVSTTTSTTTSTQQSVAHGKSLLKSTLHQLMQKTTNPYSQHYHENWPQEMPFHQGELALQHKAGVHESVMTYAPKLVRPYMPEQHRNFYESQPFLVVAGRDAQGQMWSTLLTSPTGQANVVQSPNPVTLQLNAHLPPTDALSFENGGLQEGSDLGILGIEFATKRRNRVNGRIIKVTREGGSTSSSNAVANLTFSVDQAYGNCPQYIKPRKWWTTDTTSNDVLVEQGTIPRSMMMMTKKKNRSTELSRTQMNRIANAETIFVASGYRGEGEDVRYGNDSSHRGGPAGFVTVQDSKTLILPEFAGNNIFNTLGNLYMDTRMGITIPSFDDGGLLQLTGTATVNMDTMTAALFYPGALRLTIFTIEQVNEVPSGSLPVRWTTVEGNESRQLCVTSIVQESLNVKSFYMQSIPQEKGLLLWQFIAGQHLPIHLRTPDGEVIRTYSLSGSPHNRHEYRISIKREPLGKASRFLHDQIQVGDIVQVNRPAGDFMLAPNQATTTNAEEEHVEEGEAATQDKNKNNMSSEGPLVLLSSGIGVTPILSMLHQVVAEEEEEKQAVANANSRRRRRHRRQNIVWVHGARNVNYHPFRTEVKDLIQRLESSSTDTARADTATSITTHIVYSQPNHQQDRLNKTAAATATTTASSDTFNDFDSQGHINVKLVERLVGGPDQLQKAHVYMCGSGGFMANMEEGLLVAGVDPQHIFFETF